MTNYSPPDPSVAEYIHRKQQEGRRHQERLSGLSPEALTKILYDPSEPANARTSALMQLVNGPGRDSIDRQRLVELAATLLDDGDPEVARFAMRHCPLTDEFRQRKAFRLLECADDSIKAEAAVALAKAKVEEIFPVLMDWFQGEARGLHNGAIEGFKTLDSTESRCVLEQSYESGGRDFEDKIALGVALLRLGDKRAIDMLRTVARQAEGVWSVVAAAWIYAEHDPQEGLQLMATVLDSGDLEATGGMVSQIWNFNRSPHAFTADGIHEARHWVQQQLARQEVASK